MREPDTAVFYAEVIDDEFGEGIGLHDSADRVYELRDGAVQTRIYPEDGAWRVKSRTPVDGIEEAYEVFRDTAHRVGDLYDRDGTVPAYTFMNDSSCRHLSFDPAVLEGEIRYRITDGVDLDVDVELAWRQAMRARMTSAALGGGVFGTVLAAVGGGLGLAIGDPVSTAMLGGAVGGSLGAAAAGSTDDNIETLYEQRRERMRRKVREEEEERVRDRGNLADATLLERVNERNRLAAEKDSSEDFKQAERLKELEAGDAGELFDAAMDLNFDQFHRWDGVIVDAEIDTYGEAYRFASAVADAPERDVERPSIYTDKDAFRGVFEALPDADRDVLVENVLEHGASDAVTAYLDAKHTDRVRRVGGETMLDAGTEEGSDR